MCTPDQENYESTTPVHESGRSMRPCGQTFARTKVPNPKQTRHVDQHQRANTASESHRHSKQKVFYVPNPLDSIYPMNDAMVIQ